jgi:ribonucleoside-diphosphate reductase subunit M1
MVKVINRKNQEEDLDLQKIIKRINSFCPDDLDATDIGLKVIQSIHDRITTSELDQETSRICMNLSLADPRFSKLSSDILISDHQKNVRWTFSEAMRILYTNTINGKLCPLISQDIYEISQTNAKRIEARIDWVRDFDFDFFGFLTLKKAYMLRTSDGIIRETPQFLFMRVALGIWKTNLAKVFESYDMMSLFKATHATPTLFNSGTPTPGLASCFLLGVEDSVPGVYKTFSDCAKISKWAGGIGLHISNIRCKGSYIRGTGGKANGILPMLKVFNETARYINQSGKRNGSFAIFIEPWHGDIFTFLRAMRKHGSEDTIVRDLFFGLWIPNDFMEAVKANKEWYLMCPDQCPGLNNVYGQAFTDLYQKYISENKYLECIQARDIWEEITKSQIESGMPYMVYKDHVNEKSNQKNIGTIKSSNLCVEICEYSDSQEYGVCTLASICLPRFLVPLKVNKEEIRFYSVINNKDSDLIRCFLDQQKLEYQEIDLDPEKEQQPYVSLLGKDIKELSKIIENFGPRFDYKSFRQIVHTLVENLNQIIDVSFYSTPEAKQSNLRHRPIGIGIQGLADLFAKMWIPFTSKQAKKKNREIFEYLYYYALEKSCDLARAHGMYDTFKGSPLSEGIFQFNLWNDDNEKSKLNWNSLRNRIKKYGLRNSLLIALMPTASTSQIMGCTECFEPRTSNLYKRTTLSGEFQIVNLDLVRVLQQLNLWTKIIRDKLIQHRGSIQKIEEIPQYVKDLFQTAYEIRQKDLIQMSADRGKFICQSQSLNFFVEKCNSTILTQIHFEGYRKGLKTGSYYIRSKPSVNADTFTLEPCLSCTS